MPSNLSLWLYKGAPAFPISPEDLKIIRDDIVRATQQLDACRIKLESGVSDTQSVIELKTQIQTYLDSIKPAITRVRDTLVAIRNLEQRNARADRIFQRLRHVQFFIVSMILGFELLAVDESFSRWIVIKAPALSAFILNVVYMLPVGGELEYLASLKKDLKRGFVLENLCICVSLAAYAYSHGGRAIALTAAYWVLFIAMCYVNKFRFVELLKATGSI